MPWSAVENLEAKTQDPQPETSKPAAMLRFRLTENRPPEQEGGYLKPIVYLKANYRPFAEGELAAQT
jgi:hypothetical protein